jgi:hypothetical protein
VRRRYGLSCGERRRLSALLGRLLCMVGARPCFWLREFRLRTLSGYCILWPFLTDIGTNHCRRRIVSELTGTVLVAADRENKIQEWRHTLLTKIARFRTLQRIYMPGAMDAIAAAEEERENDDPAPKPEHIKLWMPNEMAATGPDDLLRGCVPGMVDMEARLRVAQCENSLVGLRSRLHAKRFLIDHRNANVTGQVASTKARTLIGQVGERVDAQAKRYRRGRAALVALKGSAAYPHFRVLAPGDLTLDGDGEDTDAAARKKLAMIGAGRGARTPRNVAGTSKRVMSWIWTAPGAFDDEEQHLHDCELGGAGGTRVSANFPLISDPCRMVSCACAQSEMVRRGNASTRGDAKSGAVSGVADCLVAGSRGAQNGFDTRDCCWGAGLCPQAGRLA